MKLAILGANYQYLSFYKQAKSLGYEIVSFGRAEDDHVCAEYADKFFPISFTEQEVILEICKEEKVDGITSFIIENALPNVYYISRGLGIPCNSMECESLTKDKQTMREQMKKENVKIPAYKAISSIDEPHNIPFPIIVKPADSGGSRGVSLVSNQEQLDQAVERALNWSKNKTVMVEQFIEGREFSIEAISYLGEHYIVQITDKVTTNAPYFVELEHHQPASLTKGQKEDIIELTIQTLNSLKVEYGASHTEIKMDKNNNLYVIEMGPRMGGDYIQSDLVRLSTGYDLVKGVIEVSTGRFTLPKIDFNQQVYAGVYFLTQETEKKVLPYIEHKDKYPFVVEADVWGDTQPVKCNSDRGGYFIYQSDKKLYL